MPDSPENRLCRIQRAIELQAVEGIGLVYARRLWELLGSLHNWVDVDFQKLYNLKNN